MKQVAIAVMWGVLEESVGRYPLAQLPSLLDKLKSLGYGGIELPVAYIMKYGSSKFEALLQEKGMKCVVGVFSSGPPPVPGMLGIASEFGIEHPKDDLVNFHNVERHQAVWRAQVEEAARIRSVVLKVNSHTGRDYFTPEEADDMFAYCVKAEAEVGLEINHETHRARTLYSPWVVLRYLKAHPGLHLCADYSHYSNVAELGSFDPYTTPLTEVITACNPRVRHVHARVGFEEGPQIPDPRTPTWRPYFDGYLKWWTGVVRESAAAGRETFSVTPEFGPPAYAWTDPYNGDKPIVNVWDVNHWVGQQFSAMVKAEGHEAAVLLDDPHKGVWDLQ